MSRDPEPPGPTDAGSSVEAALAPAREAASRGEWQHAYEQLLAADTRAPLRGPDLGLLADMAYASGHFDVTVATWERAYAESLRAGDRIGAAGAAVRVAMHLLFDTALMAPVRGWAKRVATLLDGVDETPIHAWLAVVQSYERLLSGDFQEARRFAASAIHTGDRCAPAASAVGRVAAARTVILEGDVSRGMALLDEAAVAAVSGELDPLSTGIVYCEVVCALQALAQYDLAEQWTESMERWRHGQPVGSVHGRCRVHRAEILRLRGSLAEAEEEALQACEELRPYLRREFGWPLTELGRIRLRKDDVEGAEAAFVGAHEAAWDPQPGLALVQLAQGDAPLASASIRDALGRPGNVPSKEVPPASELRRAPLLEAQVEIEIAAGNLEVARLAGDELSRIAARFESRALAAAAMVARGRVRLAEDDAAGARREFEDAARLWNEIGAPWETATARMGAGEACRAEGNETLAVLEFRAASATFARIGATDQATRAADASQAGREPRHGSQARERESPDEHVFRRDGDLWLLVFASHSSRVRDLKGLHYLARLLADPGREYHVVDLVTAESGLRVSPGEHAGELLDDRAKQAYRRRLTEIEEDLLDAEAVGDARRFAQAEEERDFLLRELSRAVGLGGRDRRAGSTSERARVSVTRAMRQAIVRIREQNAHLAEHLDRSVRTGIYCAYEPDAPVLWTLTVGDRRDREE